jgi:hypothetical protein
MGVAIGQSPGEKNNVTHGWAPGWEKWGDNEPSGFGKFGRAWLLHQNIHPGILRNDAATYSDWRSPHIDLYFKVNRAQRDWAQTAYDRRQAESGQQWSYYNLYTRNCSDFVEDVLHAAGMRGVPGHAVFWPRELYPILAAEADDGN